MKVSVIINPASGRNNIGDYVEDILNLIKKKGGTPEIHTTTGKDDARQYLANHGAGSDMIVGCGGDGTLSEVINSAVDLPGKPPIAYIPSGTTNDFSKTMGLPTDILKALMVLSHGVSRALDVGKFEDRYFIYVASFGLFAESSYATPRKLKRRLGRLAYMITGAKELLNLRSYRMTVTDDTGKVREGDYIYGSVSNSTSIGGLMKLDDRIVDLSDGRHEVVLIRKPSRMREFNDVIRAVISGKYDSPLIEVFSAKSVTFACEDKMDWSLDGEHKITSEPVKITNIPQAVRLIFPKG